MTAVNRRSFLRLGLLALAAPAIVRASSLMQVRAWLMEAPLVAVDYGVMSSIGLHRIRDLLLPGLLTTNVVWTDLSIWREA